MDFEEIKKDINNLIFDINNFKKEILNLNGLIRKGKSQVIILTTTVHVIDNIDCCFQRNKDDRINSYVKAVSQWLEKTNLNIVLVENSGYDFPEFAIEKEKYKDRFEVITYKESELEESKYLINRNSKGEHELFSIQYAYKNSKFIKNSSFIIKITGRFFIPGFEEYLKEIEVEKFNALTQHDNLRCEMLGANHKYFYQLFDLNINYPIVEHVYKERSNAIENTHHCKLFPIEPTQRGGLNELFHNI